MKGRSPIRPRPFPSFNRVARQQSPTDIHHDLFPKLVNNPRNLCEGRVRSANTIRKEKTFNNRLTQMAS